MCVYCFNEVLLFCGQVCTHVMLNGPNDILKQCVDLLNGTPLRHRETSN